MKLMNIRLARGAFALVILASTISFAGKNQPGAIPAEKIDVQPNANPRFGCELRRFDLSQGLFCYGPAAMRAAYGVDGLLNAGFNGAGQTIVILDAFGSPFIAKDLKLFDSVFGLPDPPSFKQILMPGTPPFDPNDGNIVGWTAEIALDVEWSHAMAPAANIVLIGAKSNSDEDLIAGLNFALDNHLGSIVSMSFGQTEASLANPDGLDVVAAWQAAFAKARKNRVTLFVSSGDDGSATGQLGFQSASFPATSDLVTSVGGTNLRFGTTTAATPPPTGTYQSETVWNDGFGAGGGGMSILIAEPDFQRDAVPAAVNRTLHRFRGVPDVAYNAGVVGGVVAAWSALIPNAFFIFGGTSAGAPQWSGIVADINQASGRPVGFINKQLYKLGRQGRLSTLFRDITTGDNSFLGVPGFPATVGFDLSTGFGTPNFSRLGALLGDQDDDRD